MERRPYLRLVAVTNAPKMKQTRLEAGPVHESRQESGVEEGTQPLRDRFVENMIIEGMEEACPIRPAGNKIADLAIDRQFGDLRFTWKAVLGEIHGVVFLPQLESCLCHILRWGWPSGHRDVSLDVELPTFCNTGLSHAK